METEARVMQDDYEEIWDKPKENSILFDNPDEIPTLSGHNEDKMDLIRKVCFNCGATNGQHLPSCEEDFI